MEPKKYQIVPTVVETYFRDSFNSEPSLITLPLITSEGFETITAKMEEVWSTNFFFDKKLFKFEGLCRNPSSTSLLYYRKSEDENTYKIVFVYEKQNEDTIVFMANSLRKYEIISNENFNITRTQGEN
jgi:hypothetical protein